jgi:hypothetical protein
MKNKNFFFVAMLLCSFSPLFSQSTSFIKTLGNAGNSIAADVKQAADGSVLILSQTTNGDSIFAKLSKIDTLGKLLWQRSFAFYQENYPRRIQILGNGQILLLGRTFTGSNLERGGFLLTLDANGLVLGSAVHKTECCGDYVVMEYAFKNNDGTYQYFFDDENANGATIARADANGKLLKAFNLKVGSAAIQIKQVVNKQDGQYYVFGEKSYNEPMLFAMDSLGVSTWGKQFSTTRPFFLSNNMVRAQAGHLFVTGLIDPQTGSRSNPWVSKINENGTTDWSKEIVLPAKYTNVSIYGTTAVGNDIVLIGQAYTQTDDVMFFMKLSTTGTVVWSRLLSKGNAYGSNIIELSNGNLFMTAYDKVGNSEQIMMIKTDAMGKTPCFGDTTQVTIADAPITQTNIALTTTPVTPTTYPFSVKNGGTYPLSIEAVCSNDCEAFAVPTGLNTAATCASESFATMPKLTWSKIQGAKYRLRIEKYPFGATDSVWATDCLADTSVTPAFTLQKGMVYRWRIQSINGDCAKNCTSPWSDVRYFDAQISLIAGNATTICPLSTITLTAPTIIEGSNDFLYLWYDTNGYKIGEGKKLEITKPGKYTLAIQYALSFCSGSQIKSAVLMVTAGAPDEPTGVNTSGACNTFDVTTPPRLTWTAVPNLKYRVIIEKYPHLVGDTVIVSPCLTTNSYQPTFQIEPGMMYRWYPQASFECGATACWSQPANNTDYGNFQGKIELPASITFCKGDSVTLKATPLKLSKGEITYRWLLNDTATILEGINKTELIVKKPANYRLQYLFPNTGSWCFGATIESYATSVVETPLTVPTVKITTQGCPTNNLTFTAVPTNGGTNPLFAWYRNKETTSIATGSTFNYTGAKKTDKITCRMAIGAGIICPSQRTVVSDTTVLDCVISKTNDLDNVKHLAVYPNPSTGLFNLELRLDKASLVNFTVKNIIGQVIYQNSTFSKSNNFTEIIDLIHQPSGQYLLEIKMDNQLIVNKLIKN